jgi:ribosome-binding protein aMBF1 (putative translation factor)
VPCSYSQQIWTLLFNLVRGDLEKSCAHESSKQNATFTQGFWQPIKKYLYTMSVVGQPGEDGVVNQEETIAAPELLLAALANAVVTRRMQLNMSQDDLCKRSGINRSQIARLEAGLLDADVNTLWKLSTVLQMPIGELLEMAETELGL